MAKNTLSPSKLSPWNWFKHEDEKSSDLTPRRDFDWPMQRMHEEMDRIFDETFRSFGFPSVFRRGGDVWKDMPDFWRPSVDISERDTEYKISVEIPGVSEEDIKLNVDGNQLIIRGEKQQEEKSEDKGKIHRIERRYGSFHRSLALPHDANLQDIHASFKDGVLDITVPRDTSKEPEAGRSIPINKS